MYNFGAGQENRGCKCTHCTHKFGAIVYNTYLLLTRGSGSKYNYSISRAREGGTLKNLLSDLMPHFDSCCLFSPSRPVTQKRYFHYYKLQYGGFLYYICILTYPNF